MNEDVVLLWPLLFEGKLKINTHSKNLRNGRGDGYDYGNGDGNGYGYGDGDGYGYGGAGQK
jgi:hypothetical protein